jgi:hypothetical protein
MCHHRRVGVIVEVDIVDSRIELLPNNQESSVLLAELTHGLASK